MTERTPARTQPQTQTQTLANGDAIPVLGFGTWLLKEGPECFDAVSAALRSGYRHVDTARAYHNEASVGRAVRESGIERAELFVTSKLPAEAKSYDRAVAEFETTMRELDLDYLDLYLVHAPWPWEEMGKDCRAQNREIWKAMEEFLAAGRVKAIGVSNFGPDDLDSLLPACTTVPMVNQIRWFVGLDPSETVRWCAEHGVVVEAYSPFAHGLIVNHPEIAELAAGYDVSAAQLCIRYLLHKGAVVLPKATSAAHIQQNAQLDFVITDADLATLDAMRDTDQHPDAAPVRWS